MATNRPPVNARSPSAPAADLEQPSDVLACIALPLIVFEVEQFLLRRFKDDAEAMKVVAAAVNELKQHCTRHTGKPFPPEGA